MSTDKTKGLFDHLNAIYLNQSPKYWDNLSETDRKSYSTFMINRFLSMNMDYVEVVNALQLYYGSVGPRESYLFYSDLLPRGKQWNKYVKGKKPTGYDDWLLELVAQYYEVSQSEAEAYLDLFYLTGEGKESLRNLLEKYGTDPKKIKKVVK